MDLLPIGLGSPQFSKNVLGGLCLLISKIYSFKSHLLSLFYSAVIKKTDQNQLEEKWVDSILGQSLFLREAEAGKEKEEICKMWDTSKPFLGQETDCGRR